MHTHANNTLFKIAMFYIQWYEKMLTIHWKGFFLKQTNKNCMHFGTLLCKRGVAIGREIHLERFPQNKQWLSPVVGLWVGFAFFVSPFYTFEFLK